jgi:hypothetical protein
VLAGCGERVSDRSPGGGATQRITADFGATTLHEGATPAGRTVMDGLRTATEVKTSFAGKFVDGMFARRSDGERAWLYYVNGVLADRGAADQTVREGDVVWWDYRRWSGVDAPAVVGAWPEPFVHGYPDAPKRVSADPELAAPLRAAGAPLADGPATWRVIVGTDPELRRRDPAWRRAASDPEAAGLSVRIDDGRIHTVGTDGHRFIPVPGARAIAVAILAGDTPGDGVVMAVVGLDRPGAVAAAGRIARDPSVLRNRVAVAFDASGAPVAAGGQGPL